MKSFIKNNKILVITSSLTVILFLSLFIPLHLPGNPRNYTNEGKDIVFKYEIVGCGGLVRKIEKGGAAIYREANLPEPESGVYEVQFTQESDEPEKHIDSAEFYCGGVAGEYSYYMTVEVVGTERGAEDCCITRPAYNEEVPLVKVVKWEPKSFTPAIYFNLIHYITIMVLPIFLLIDIIMLIRSIYFWKKRRKC